MLNLSSRPVTILLSVLLIFMQYQIWSTNGGLSQVWKTKQSIIAVQEQNQELQEKNAILAADVNDLKNGDESIEEHARTDLGMIKQGEVFYQIVD
jgi:cell division protein FtsB